MPVTDYTYDDLDRPSRVTENLTTAEGGNRVTDTVYNLDDTVANVARAVGSAVAQTYATYTYTPNSLVATVKDAKNNLTAYQYDGHDRKLKTLYPHPTTAGTASTTDYEQYGFDANGNLTSLRKRNGQSITLAYDNLNRLTSRSYEGTTTTDKSWLYKDHLGSVIGTADATGTSTVIYSYGPYGEPNTTAGQRFRYTGQQLIKELGLYYYKARFYSPALGRFMQTDPIGTTDDLNLYGYVGNNPVNYADPNGLMAKEAQLLGQKITSGASNWWEASVAGFQSEGLSETVQRVLQAIPAEAGLMAGAGIVKGAGGQFSN